MIARLGSATAVREHLSVVAWIWLVAKTNTLILLWLLEKARLTRS